MPSKNCIVRGCKSSKNITMHRFPIKSSDDFNIWVKRTGNDALLLMSPPHIYKSYVMCDKHFEVSCQSPGTKRLKFKSLPTLNLPNTLHSTILEPLIDYMYTGDIMATKENVQGLLQAAEVVKLGFVMSSSVSFLKTQLNSTNCLGVRAFAKSINNEELLSSSETYIKQNFLEVIENNEFLSINSDDLIKFISCYDLVVPFEEKVFEFVIKWVKYNLDERKKYLPKIMEHVHMPLIRPDILRGIVKEPLLQNEICQKYIIEALDFYLQKSIGKFAIPNSKRCKLRQFNGSQKVFLMFNLSEDNICSMNWYDPDTKKRYDAPGLIGCRKTAGICVIKDQYVFVVGGVNKKSSNNVSMLDVSSQFPEWLSTIDMVVSRKNLGLGILNDEIYAVGGHDGTRTLNSVEVIDPFHKQWKRIPNMSQTRANMGIGVLNNYLYAVGGTTLFCNVVTNTVERYDPEHGIWKEVQSMSTVRKGAGVGILDGKMYAIGGEDLKCGEVYIPGDENSIGVWKDIPDMHLCRFRPGVFGFNEFLYVIGGTDTGDTLEIYNPSNKTWIIETLIGSGVFGGVVVDRPLNYL